MLNGLILQSQWDISIGYSITFFCLEIFYKKKELLLLIASTELINKINCAIGHGLTIEF